MTKWDRIWLRNSLVRSLFGASKKTEGSALSPAELVGLKAASAQAVGANYRAFLDEP